MPAEGAPVFLLRLHITCAHNPAGCLHPDAGLQGIWSLCCIAIFHVSIEPLGVDSARKAIVSPVSLQTGQANSCSWGWSLNCITNLRESWFRKSFCPTSAAVEFLPPHFSSLSMVFWDGGHILVWLKEVVQSHGSLLRKMLLFRLDYFRF